MATDNFDVALRYVLGHEGGYVNHPKDPGGATNKGVTQAVYDNWRARQGQAKQSVRKITDAEVSAIYRRQYWDVVSADDLPSGVDYAVFDFAVNSGPARAARYLQKCIGAKRDGLVGSETIAKASERDEVDLIDQLCQERLKFVRGLKTYKTFGRGWERRIRGDVEGVQADDVGVLDRATDMAMDRPVMSVPKTACPGKAEGEKAAGAVVGDLLKDPKVLASGAGAVATAATSVAKVPWENLLILGAVACVFGVVLLQEWKRKRADA